MTITVPVVAVMVVVVEPLARVWVWVWAETRVVVMLPIRHSSSRFFSLLARLMGVNLRRPCRQ